MGRKLELIDMLFIGLLLTAAITIPLALLISPAVGVGSVVTTEDITIKLKSQWTNTDGGVYIYTVEHERPYLIISPDIYLKLQQDETFRVEVRHYLFEFPIPKIERIVEGL